MRFMPLPCTTLALGILNGVKEGVSPSDKSLRLHLMGWHVPSVKLTQHLQNLGWKMGWLLHGMCHVRFRGCSTQKARNDA